MMSKRMTPKGMKSLNLKRDVDGRWQRCVSKLWTLCCWKTVRAPRVNSTMAASFAVLPAGRHSARAVLGSSSSNKVCIWSSRPHQSCRIVLSHSAASHMSHVTCCRSQSYEFSTIQGSHNLLASHVAFVQVSIQIKPGSVDAATRLSVTHLYLM